MAQENRRRGQRRAAARARPSALTATPAVGPDPRERLRTLGTVLVRSRVSAAYAGRDPHALSSDDRTAAGQSVDHAVSLPIEDAVTRGPLIRPCSRPRHAAAPELTFALNYRFALRADGVPRREPVPYVPNARCWRRRARTLRPPVLRDVGPVASGLASRSSSWVPIR
jgi:hypothetical protein